MLSQCHCFLRCISKRRYVTPRIFKRRGVMRRKSRPTATHRA
ncbi:hypothetical protein P355_4117 [Burkholderia cenocepacia KC-01]|nr:hypothetical protein P355_4117 [Burkholderia cenocepacia KC-01]